MREKSLKRISIQILTIIKKYVRINYKEIIMNTKTHNKIENEKVVKNMIDTWDIVKCRICGKDISMLTSKTDGKYFVCKGHLE